MDFLDRPARRAPRPAQGNPSPTVEMDFLDRSLRGAPWPVAAPAGGNPHGDPTGGPVSGAGKAVSLDEGLQQINRMTVLSLPVTAQAPGDPAQDMAGQMRHSYPGQDEETGVVGQPREMAATPFRGPADEGVAGLALPGGRAKQ